MSHLTYAIDSLNHARPEYDEALAYHEGRAPEYFASTHIKNLLKTSGAAFRINWCRQIISSVLNRLEVTSITSTDDTQQELIEKLWMDNLLGIEARAVHESALVNGNTYLIVWNGEEEGTVDISHNSPLSTRIFYDLENPKRPSYAVKSWLDEDEHLRANLYYRDRIERYISVNPWKTGQKFDEDSFLEFESEDAGAFIENPYGVIPVFHMRNQLPYGRPDHAEGYGPQNLLNKLVISHIASVDHVVLPQRYILTEGSLGEGSPPPDQLWHEDGSPDQADPNLTSEPGSAWILNGRAAGQFQAADVDNFLKPIQAYILAMAQSSDTPVHAFSLSAEPPSGESRRMAEMPLISKVRNRQAAFGHTWREVFTFALEILGQQVQDGSISVEWRDASQREDKEAWETVALKIANGVPPRQALIESGYSEKEADSFGFTSNDVPLNTVPAPAPILPA